MVWTKHRDPVVPPDYDEDVVLAFLAMQTGTASEPQQQLVMRWLQYVAGVGEFEDLSYRPGDERATTFAEGKRFVGLQVRKMLHPLTLEATRKSNEASKRGKR